uniref:RNA-dependent RNA polymerase n=1 Tax=Sweet potato chlorotic fleck virus TaxID=263004 RepID=A0A5Q0LPV4_9VIRU|nr:RNA-dependent RNA polymerase [Sweet potato chlorotic fleck virus]
MSLTFRSPAEEALSSFSSVEQSQITRKALATFISIEEREHTFFNYAVKIHAKERLTNAGIYLSPVSPVPHSHPVCKILENYLLYKVLPSIIDNSFFFVGIKDNKFAAFKTREPKLDMVTCINRFVTSHDKNRYFGWRSAKCSVSEFSATVDKSPCLKDLVPQVLNQRARNIFLHDEIHYWSRRELITFLEVAKPERVIATLVFPPEILAGSKVSLNRWCYEYEIRECGRNSANGVFNFRAAFRGDSGKALFFYPDGVRAEGYEQPLDSGFLLKTRRIVCNDGTVYSVDIVCSKFAHHLISITRGSYVGRSSRSFGDFEAITTRGLSKVSSNMKDAYPICYTTVNRIYRYLRSLVKPDVQSAVSKLSQTVGEPTGAEIKFVEEFSKLVISTHSVNNLIGKEDFKVLQGLVAGTLPRMFAQRFKEFRAISLDEFICELAPYSFNVDLVDLKSDTCLDFIFYDVTYGSVTKDPAVLMEKVFTEGAEGVRLNGLYHCDESHTHVLELSGAATTRLFSRFTRAYLGNLQHQYNMENLKECISNFKKWFKDNKILGLSFYSMEEETAFKVYRRVKAGKFIRREVVYQSDGLIWFLNRHPKSRGKWYSSNTKFITGDDRNIAKMDMGVLCIYRRVLNELTETMLKSVQVDSNEDSPCPLGKSAPQEGINEAPVILKDGETRTGTPLGATFPETTTEPRGGDLEGERAFRDEATSRIKEMVNARAVVISEINFEGLKIPILKLRTFGPLTFDLTDDLGNRVASWYTKGKSVVYRYKGGSHESKDWLDMFNNLLTLNGLPTDYYDSVLVQEYKAGGGINFHKDDEEIFEKGAKVLTVNLYGQCYFSFSSSKETVSFELVEDSYFEMPKGFQENYYHGVQGCSMGRISMTFRRLNSNDQSEVVEPQSTVSVEQNKNPTEAQNDDKGKSEFRSTETSENSEGSGDDTTEVSQFGYDKHRLANLNLVVKKYCESEMGRMLLSKKVVAECNYEGLNRICACELGLNEQYVKEKADHFMQVLPIKSAEMISDFISDHNLDSCLYNLMGVTKMFNLQVTLFIPAHCLMIQVEGNSGKIIELAWDVNLQSIKLLRCANDCCIRAVADALERPAEQVIEVLRCKGGVDLMEEVTSGQGLELEHFEQVLTLFDICGVCFGDFDTVLNEGGRLLHYFYVEDGHVEHFVKNRNSSKDKIDALKNREDLLDLKRQDGMIGAKGGGNLYLRRGRKSFDPKNNYILDLSAVKPASTSLKFVSTEQRYDLIKNSLLVGDTGVLFDKNFDKMGLLESRKWNEWSGMIGVILGVYGCGKSTLFKKLVSKNPRAYIHIVSPRKALASEMKLALEESSDEQIRRRGHNTTVSTFERFVQRALQSKFKCDALLIDEIQLYPPGYLDLVVNLVKPKEGTVFLIGDPCQSDYDSLRDRLTFSNIKPDIELLLEDKEYKYNFLSRRFRNKNFIGRLNCVFDENLMNFEEPYVICNNFEECRALTPKYHETFLVSSFEEKKVVAVEFPNCEQILTFGESTGRNFRYGTLVITGTSKYVNEKRWVTALSRFSHNLAFLNLTGYGIESVCQQYSGLALNRFLTAKAGPNELMESLPGKPVLTKGFTCRMGKDYQVKELKLQGDPWLKTMINLGQLEDFQEEEMSEVISQIESVKTHVPLSYLEGVRATWNDRFKAKEDREFKIKGLITDQFADEHSKNNGFKLTNAAERFAAIYPRHKSGDTATFLMGVRKRLRFSKPAVECAKYRDAACFGPFMLKEFLQRVPIKPGRSSIFFDKAVQDFEEKKTAKSTATIENHSGRSNLDWKIDTGLVFMKSQNCTKFENRFRDAKAAQTIVCFHHIVLARFAPFIRYIEMKVNEALPKNYYIHSGKSLDELNNWVIDNDFTRVCTESDYEAFDASQDAYILAFEICLMEHLCLPRDLIEDYKYIKTHLGSKLGNFSIMRFSGEASTFLFNTIANMLFTFLKYDLNGSESICFAGDDMCANRRLRLKTEHDGFLSKLKLKAKVCFTSSPTFCGWNLSFYGIYKRPELVFERLCIAKENGNFKECLDNYAIELSYAYKLGEKVLPLMDESAVQSYYQCIRIIIQWKHLLKSKIALDFANSVKA